MYPCALNVLCKWINVVNIFLMFILMSYKWFHRKGRNCEKPGTISMPLEIHNKM